MPFTLLIPKETRAFEQRVSLVPKDVSDLVAEGHRVFIEHNAGLAAGFSDEAYVQAGARIRVLNGSDLNAYQALFADINLIVRVKRPERSREMLENHSILLSTIMIGALDPLEKNSPHMAEYQQAGMTIHSLDQLPLAPSDPMNLLAAMSQLAGKMALQDALAKVQASMSFVVIIGFGVVGQAAAQEAQRLKLAFKVIMSNQSAFEIVTNLGGTPVLLDKTLELTEQQAIVHETIKEASIVITSARHANQAAPLLIPLTTLQQMRAGSVVVDMALSEGGNVEGAEHDATHVLGNGVLVTNVSGYPKAMPHEASVLWSRASRLFIERL